MADFAISLAKTALEGTLSRVQSAIEEEGKLKVTVQHDLVFITGEFQMMQSFLEVASKERANNKVVKTWVRQLRDLALDVEDCVEFVVHLDNSSSWSWMWRVIPSCMAPPRPLDDAVAEMKQLKARLEDVSHRNARYNLISDSGSKHLSSPAPPAAVAVDILREIWEAEGKSCAMDDLENLITTEGDNHQVISLWESTGGDIEAVSILRNLYSDQRVCHKFRRCAWVKLVHPFNPDEFLRSMLTQFCSSCQDPTKPGDDFTRRVRAALAMEDDVMKAQELKQLLSDQTYLVILENVSTIVEWDFISSFLPNNKNCSRIVVSTKQLKIATLSTGEPNQVLKLSEAQSLFVFLNKNVANHNGFGGGEASRSRLDKAREYPKEIEIIWSPQEMFGILKLIMNHGVIPVWGIAGLGKSSLVRAIYYDALAKPYQDSSSSSGNTYETFTKYSWVDVPNPFNLMEFARRLFLDFHSDDDQKKQMAAIRMVEGQDPIQGCRKIMGEGKCFIVIDDLSSAEDWDMIKAVFLPHLRSDNSIMVVITSQASVARHCVVNDESKMVNVKGLVANSAFDLFKKKVWGDNCALTTEEEELSKHTVARCGGLPTVIFAIGKYCSKAESRHETKCLLEDINNDFINKMETHPDLQHLFSWIRSYFDACSDSVKPCIFYLSIFPSGSKIRRRRLLRRWIAEGYSRDTPVSTAEENAANLFSELVNLSIILKTGSNAEAFIFEGNYSKLSQVNTFLHEYIISQRMEDNLVFALEGSCSPNTQRAGRHLTIRSSWSRDYNVFKSIDFSRLRSLTVLGEWMPFFISNEIKMRVLRVLDLENNMWVQDNDLEEIGKLLPRLKFLSLRGCQQIKQLPDSFGGLRQLQTLDVRHTSIVMLPLTIFQIEKLQYIRAGTSKWHADDDMLTVVHGNDQTSEQTEDHDGSSMQPVATSSHAQDDTSPVPPAVPRAAQKNKKSTCPWVSWLSKDSKPRDSSHNQGVEVPAAAGTEKLTALPTLGVINVNGVEVPAAAEIGELIALHTLGVIDVNSAGGKAVMKKQELKKLTQLHKLGVSGINSGNIKDFFSAISDHRLLESLSLRLDEDIPDDISIPKPVAETLKSLRLYGDMKKLPVSWIEQLLNLKKLKLELTISGQGDINAILALLSIKIQKVLTHLCIKLIGQGGKLKFPSDFTLNFDVSLAVLEIDCISSSEVTLGYSMLYSNVRLLKVHCSKGASFTLSGLEQFISLKEVWLMGSFDDTLKIKMLGELAKHERKPVLKMVKHCSS